MTGRQIAALIDTDAWLKVDSLTFPVVIRDVRQVFGRTDYLLEPFSGTGEQWISGDRVTLEGATS